MLVGTWAAVVKSDSQLHVCAPEDAAHWRHRQNEERWWKGTGTQSGKMMVRKRRKLPKWTGIWCTNDAKVREYFARCKEQRQARKKVLPLMLWGWHVTAGQAECHHCPMVNLLKLSTAGCCITPNNYLIPYTYLQIQNFLPSKSSHHASGSPWVYFHQKCPSINSSQKFWALYCLNLGRFFSLQLSCYSHLNSPLNFNALVHLF